ncbi:MAG: DUF72 domain-containing protein [Acidobacteriia bacterium]|nr:DUF72 domain-containing protein [Terriglobia bacterium]
MSQQRLRVGTSGWHYDHWLGPFYPETLRSHQMLAFYCQRLDTVEINNSFYHLPAKETFRAWKEQTPRDFLFAVKASRYITHMKKLKDPATTLEKFLLHAGELGNKLGPMLFQLPPYWKRDVARLKDFLQALPQGLRCVFEFRDATWFHAETYSALAQYGAAFCVFDLAGQESPRLLTSEFGYVRLHGPSYAKYAGCYTPVQLRGWLRLAQDWFAHGARQVFVYFDNDQAGYAARNALELQEMARAAND